MRAMILLVWLSLLAVNSWGAVLCQSPNGALVPKQSLSAAATAPDCSNKTVVVTSPLSAVLSNISSASLHAWPTDRKLKVEKGGSIGNTTKFQVDGPFEAGQHQAFTGTGSVIFGTNATTGILPQWFGAVGDGITDDTAAWTKLAACADASNHRVFIPSGTYVISSKITFAYPPALIGEAYSPPNIRAATSGASHTGVRIKSSVTGDYAIQIGDSTYRNGLQIENVHIYAATQGLAGGGIKIQNCGWGGHVKGLVVEGFGRTGVALSQLQDTIFEQLEVLKCGTDNVYPALDISTQSNLLTFIRCRLELNEWQLYIHDAGTFGITFVDCHMEQGDYPAAALGAAFQVIPQYSSIRINAANGIKFIGGTMTGATIASTIAKFPALTPLTCPYYISVDSTYDVKFIGVGMGGGFDRVKTINFQSDGAVVGCHFYFQTIEDNAIRLKGNIQFTDNTVSWVDVNANTVFQGIYGEGATVRDNYLACSNNSFSAKTTGAVFSSINTNRMKVGNNTIIINKLNYYHDGNLVLIGVPDDLLTMSLAGTIDARTINPYKILAPSASTTLTTITNLNVNQVVTIRNTNAAVSLVVDTTLPNRLKATATLVQNNEISLRFDPINGYLVESSRNF